MARVHLLTVHPLEDQRAQGGYLSVKENAELDRFRVHHLVDDPAAADLIIFAEIDCGRLCRFVLEHPLVKRYRAKCFLYSTDWRVVPWLPGIYTGLERKYYLPRRVRPGFYPSCLTNPLISFQPDDGCDLLYGFMGDINTHPVRRVLAGLPHPPDAWVDTSSESQAVMWAGSPAEHEAFWQRYFQLMKRCKFFICPRGVAPASIRMFETMCMGRVAVVLSDDWVPPAGPDWNKVILRVPEAEAARLPDILREHEAKAHEMGLAARQAWEEFFAPDVLFHRLVELCLEIQRARTLPEWLERQAIIPQLLQRRVLREYARYIKDRLTGVRY
jgi:hypothetical protein